MTAEPDPTAHLPPPSPRGPWRLLDRLVVVLFCVGLVVPGAMAAAGVRPATIENRPLLTAPPVTAEDLLDPAWYADVDAFLADNVGVRPLAVRLRAELYWRLGGTGNPAVVRGLDGWLFARPELRPTCELDAAEVVAAVDRARAAFEAAGQEFRFVGVPDKHAIYPDKLDPDMPYPPPCTDARRSELRAALEERAAFAVDGWRELDAERAAGTAPDDLFYAEDSHWTPSGALPAVRALVRSLEPGLWVEGDVGPPRERRYPVDLARQMGRRVFQTVQDPVLRPGVEVDRETLDLDVDLSGASGVFRFRPTGDVPLLPGRTVIVYDSFFGIRMASIAPFFEDSTWIHWDDLERHPELAELTGPFDRVIAERVERGIYITEFDAILAPLVGEPPAP